MEQTRVTMKKCTGWLRLNFKATVMNDNRNEEAQGLSRIKRAESLCMIVCIRARTILSWVKQVLSGQGQRQMWETVNPQPELHSSHNYKRQELFLWPQPPEGEIHFFHIIKRPYRFWKNCTHNKHCDQKILLGDLSVRKDIVQYSVHVTLILFSKSEDTFVIVTCKQQKEFGLHPCVNVHVYVLFAF